MQIRQSVLGRLLGQHGSNRQVHQQRALQRFQLARLHRKQLELIEDQTTEIMLHVQEKQLALLLFQQSSIGAFIKKLAEAPPPLLRAQLQGNDPLARYLALLAIGKRRLHLEKDLIELLRDKSPFVRKAAHWCLLKITRGTDFGPIPGSSQKGIDRSIEKWGQWLTLQQSGSPEKLVRDTAIAAEGKQAKPAPAELVPLLLVRDDKPTVSPAVAQACDELMKAKGKEQMSLLARLRESKDNDSTEALALAIAQLSDDIRQQARDVLIQRLSRLSSALLRDRLQDDNPEVRSAAALACGRKIAKERIADLLQLLEDPEMAVIQSARAALTELSGEDFGPTSDTDSHGRADAVAAWRKWWKERQDRVK